MRTPTAVSQATLTFLFEARLPFVTALATDPKAPAQLGHAFLGLQGQLYKLHSPHHRSQFFRRHAPEKREK
jgi:hypothetical protein